MTAAELRTAVRTMRPGGATTATQQLAPTAVVWIGVTAATLAATGCAPREEFRPDYGAYVRYVEGATGVDYDNGKLIELGQKVCTDLDDPENDFDWIVRVTSHMEEDQATRMQVIFAAATEHLCPEHYDVIPGEYR